MKTIYKRAFESIYKKLTTTEGLAPSFTDLEQYGANVYHLFPRDDLKCFIKIPCPIGKNPDQESKTVETGKRLRAAVEASEAKICQQCPLKQNCKVSFLPGQPADKNAIEDLFHYLQSLSKDEVNEKPRIYTSGLKVLTVFPQIVDLLRTDPDFPTLFENQRQSLIKERVKLEEESQTTTTKAPKAEYKKESIDNFSQYVKNQRQNPRANRGKQSVDGNFYDKQFQELDNNRPSGKRERYQAGTGRQNEFQGKPRFDRREDVPRDSRYRRQPRFEEEGRSYQRRGNSYDQQRRFNRERFQTDRNLDNTYRPRKFQRGDRDDNRSFRENREDRVGRYSEQNRERNFDRRNSYNRESGAQYDNRERRFGKDRQERPPRRSMDNLYQKYDFEKDVESQRRPVPGQEELDQFENTFEAPSGVRDRKGRRGGRSRQE